MKEKIKVSDIYQFGDQSALSLKLDTKIIKDLDNYKKYWIHYNPRKAHIQRYALSVFNETGKVKSTHSLDSLQEIHLNQFKIEESDYNKPTEVYKNNPTLQSFFSKMLPWCVKTFFLKLPPGGFFPPHRDHTVGRQETFRLIVPIENCNPPYFYFMIDGKSLYWDTGTLYIINTSKNSTLYLISVFH